MNEIYLAGGCFWGVEEYFSRIDGVISTEVGYANSSVENPSYEDVCTGLTNASECVKVTYNNDINISIILDKFWAIIDPTSLNKQGGDSGSQYRTGIYYTNDIIAQKIVDSLNLEQKKYENKIVTEVLPLENWYSAEKYHQQYLKKNPQGYCHIKLD